VTERAGKPVRWNEINPSSQKLKFGRGTGQGELKLRLVRIRTEDKWLPFSYEKTEHGL